MFTKSFYLMSVIFVMSACAPGGECYVGPYTSAISYAACRAGQAALETPDERDTEIGNKIENEELLTKARNGDAEVQYSLASSIGVNDPIAAWQWNCKAAMQAHRMAQSRMGSMYRWGLEPVSEDPARAYMWYALAATDGEPQLVKLRDRYAESLSLEKLNEGHEMLADWQPSECEMPTDRS